MKIQQKAQRDATMKAERMAKLKKAHLEAVQEK